MKKSSPILTAAYPISYFSKLIHFFPGVSVIQYAYTGIHVKKLDSDILSHHATFMMIM